MELTENAAARVLYFGAHTPRITSHLLLWKLVLLHGVVRKHAGFSVVSNALFKNHLIRDTHQGNSKVLSKRLLYSHR